MATASMKPALEETHERTRYDEALHARAVEFIEERRLTISDFADQVGYSRATLTKYISRDYVNTVHVEAALKSFFAREERKAVGSKFGATAVAMAVLESCEYAYSEGKLVVLYGPPQVGKTTGAQEFMRRKIEAGIRNLVFLTVNSTTTPFSLVRRICEELGIPLTGCTPELLERILARLKKDPHLIVVDDASHLNVRALEALRYLYDQSTCGIVLMGVKTLMERIFVATGSRMAEDLEQLYSRVDLQKYLPGAATQKDLQSVARAHGIDDRVLKLVLPHVRLPREMLKVCNRVKFLQRLNPSAAADSIVSQALSEVFRAA